MVRTCNITVPPHHILSFHSLPLLSLLSLVSLSPFLLSFQPACISRLVHQHIRSRNEMNLALASVSCALQFPFPLSTLPYSKPPGCASTACGGNLALSRRAYVHKAITITALLHRSTSITHPTCLHSCLNVPSSIPRPFHLGTPYDFVCLLSWICRRIEGSK